VPNSCYRRNPKDLPVRRLFGPSKVVGTTDGCRSAIQEPCSSVAIRPKLLTKLRTCTAQQSGGCSTPNVTLLDTSMLSSHEQIRPVLLVDHGPSYLAYKPCDIHVHRMFCVPRRVLYSELMTRLLSFGSNVDLHRHRQFPGRYTLS
jgi:hypothetical protein